jgi:hypothetical protein
VIELLGKALTVFAACVAATALGVFALWLIERDTFSKPVPALLLLTFLSGGSTVWYYRQGDLNSAAGSLGMGVFLIIVAAVAFYVTRNLE